MALEVQNSSAIAPASGNRPPFAAAGPIPPARDLLPLQKKKDRKNKLAAAEL